MAYRVDWEWVCEELDSHGEIYDAMYFADSPDGLKRALEHAASLSSLGRQFDFGLCRHTVEGEGEAEDEIDRSYAYVNTHGELPTTTDDGSRIPVRFPRKALW